MFHVLIKDVIEQFHKTIFFKFISGKNIHQELSIKLFETFLSDILLLHIQVFHPYMAFAV